MSAISRMRRPSRREHAKRIKREAGDVGVMLRGQERISMGKRL
jgi:hypothetical protein